MPEGPFGAADPEMLPGARNAVGVCLAVRPGETVVLIADEASRRVAAALARALDEADARTEPVLIEAVAARPLTEAPAPVLDGLERADAGILCIQPQAGELQARMAMVGVVERRRIRYAHMIGVTPLMMVQGMRADYHLVDRLSERLLERLRGARRLRVRAPAGTDFIATLDPRMAWVKTSGLISPDNWSNLPAGEVFTSPGSIDGTFVCDATIGDHFDIKYGDLRDTPLTLEIVEGRLRATRCARADLEREFWSYCHTDENSNRVGELALGTNIALEEVIGVLLQDEKVPGVHIAFGDPYGSQTGAAWRSRTHADLVARHCSVWIDDDQVIAEGRYLLDRLGLGAGD